MSDKVNILLVDDEPGKLLSYEVMLSSLGENLIKADSARRALEYILTTEIAVVLVDTRRLADCFPAVDYFENSGLPFVVALNGFDGHQPYTPDEVREALQIGPRTPIIITDARHRSEAKSALITLVEHALMARLQ